MSSLIPIITIPAVTKCGEYLAPGSIPGRFALTGICHCETCEFVPRGSPLFFTSLCVLAARISLCQVAVLVIAMQSVTLLVTPKLVRV